MNEEIKKIDNQIADYRKVLRQDRFANVIGQLDDTSKIKKHRCEIARLLTKKKQMLNQAISSEDISGTARK